MHKVLITVLSLCSAIVLAQTTSTGGNINTVGNRVFLSQTKLIKTSEVREGSPYYNGESFLKADISGYSKNLQELRYNAYSDEMEFMSNNEVYIADKESVSIIILDLVIATDILYYWCQILKSIHYIREKNLNF